MKKLRFFLTSIFLLCCSTIYAYDFEVNGFYYNITSSTDRTVEVTYMKWDYGDGYEFPYSDYSGAVTIPKSVIYDGRTYSVTSIGESAFYNCSSLTSVEIPNSVTSIGESAFYSCSGLTSVEIPNSVTYIGDNAFSNCSGLTSVEIPSSVTSIGGYAFYNCSSLTSVVIPNSVTNIGHSAFYGCSSLTSVEIGNSVTSIRRNVFYGTAWYNNQPDGVVYLDNYLLDYKGTMPSNTSIEIKDGTLLIADYAFEYCRDLTSVDIPNSVTSIGGGAFYRCSGLTSVVIPNSVTSIGNSAFTYCSGLTSVEIPNSVTSIGESAFYSCSGLTSVEIGSGVTSIGGDAFYGTAWYNNQPNGVVYLDNYLLDYKGTMPSNTSIEIKDGTLLIANNAFRNCSGLTSVEIPNSVTSIGESAFYSCSGLTSVEIPNSVTSIGGGAFGGCYSLTSIIVEDENSVYDSREGCNAIVESGTHTLIIGCKNTIIPNSVTSIGAEAFYCCSGLTSVKIPNSVTSIGAEAFYCCYDLTSVEIPNSVTFIGVAAFYSCSGLTSVVIGNGVTNIGVYAFHSCSGLTSVVIPNSVTSIGNSAFSYCKGLTSVEIPNSVTFIGVAAFRDCSGLTSVEIPNSVTSIGSDAFSGCSGLNSITSLNPTPPATSNYSPFSDYDVILYVPFGAKTAYSEAEYWKKFTNIEELAPSICELKDGVVYDQKTDKQVDAVIYTRTLPNLHWNALYVPFELPYDVVADRYDVAYINDVNGYDTDDNGEIDDLAMEIIKIKGGTLKANYPYLIKAKTEADKAVSITLEDAMLYAAEENAVDCSSVYQNYVVKGTYTKKSAEELAGKLAISTSGAWQPLAEGTTLNPFRLYLSIENRDNSPLKVETSAMSRMRIVEGGETTGIEEVVPSQQREDVIFDLSGRRVKQPVKGGVYIVNGKKRIL